MIKDSEGEGLHFACPGSQIYLFYDAAEKDKLVKTLQIKRVKIMAFSIFVGHNRL